MLQDQQASRSKRNKDSDDDRQEQQSLEEKIQMENEIKRTLSN